MGIRSYVRGRKQVKASRAGESANTVAALTAMAKSGTLRDAGPESTPEEKSANFYDRQDVKYEAQYGISGRSRYVGGPTPSKREAIHEASKRKDKGEI